MNLGIHCDKHNASFCRVNETNPKRESKAEPHLSGIFG